MLNRVIRRTGSVGFIIYLLLFLPAGAESQEVNCIDCHENLIAGSVHNGKTTCSDCHRDIKSDTHESGQAKPVDCNHCHSTKANLVEKDVHHKLFNLGPGKAPDCKFCHGTHKIQKISSIVNHYTQFCSKCHKENVLTSPYHAQSRLNETCSECHETAKYNIQLSSSVHPDFSCANCHSYIINNFNEHQVLPEEYPTADCYLCHTNIAKEHRESIHGISLAEGINEAAHCWNCHGAHDISFVNDKSSTVYPANLVATCGKCHDDQDFTAKFYSSIKQPGKMYSTSVHGKLVEAGKPSAGCTDCHGTHDIKNRVQSGSTISAENVPNTCIKCHKEITEEYYKSIHWIAVKKGIRESPSCNNCHSEHSIKAINTVRKRDEIKIIQNNTCLQCHQNLLLSERYGLSKQNAVKYQDSYHGLAASRGDKKAALCIDCHGAHRIMPKNYPESTISKKNIVETCRQCHKNASEVFSMSYSHVTPEDTTERYIEDLVGTIYLWIIILVIGWMLGHNLLIFIHEIRNKYRKSRAEIKIPRFTRNELIQHYILFSSFIVLAITGFQLKYPDSFWGKGLYYIGLDETARQWTHRISALVMIALSFYHLFYLLFTKRGRSVLKDFLPGISDVRQLFNNVLYYLRIRKKHPEFDNYSYIEKMEYWALIWGTVIMGITGFVLWFPTIVGQWAPLWFIKVSEIVHYYEAILATLAIIVWHWFFVIFHPSEYPLSLTCYDGKMTVSHYKKEHYLKYKKIINEYLEIKSGLKKLNDAGYFTRFFIKEVEKNGIQMDDFVNGELQRDPGLRA